MWWADVAFVPTKDHTQAEYEKLEAHLATQDKVAIKILCMDYGSEFLNHKFNAHLETKGTTRELTVHDTHEQVGVVEHFNRTKAEGARAMLLQSKLPQYLWAEAMSYMTWVTNHTPTRALNGQTPYEVCHGVKPNLKGIMPFGATTWVKLVGVQKLDVQAKPGRFIRYNTQTHGYCIYYPGQHQVGVEHKAVFDLRDVVTESLSFHVPDIIQSVGEQQKDILDDLEDTKEEDNEKNVEKSEKVDIQAVSDAPTAITPPPAPQNILTVPQNAHKSYDMLLPVEPNTGHGF